MKKNIISILLIIFAIFAIFPQNQEGQGVERYALYIASNLGGEDRATLRYAGSDAEKLSETMIELGGVKKQNSFVLVDSTKAEIDGAFRNITAIINNSKSSAKRVEFLFYYSGHSDENALLLGEETYDYSELKAKISDVPSDVHVVVLDSCFSGNFIRAKGGSRQKSFLVDDSSVVKGHAYLSSSSETESSQESDDIEASYFTQALISGLRGAADTSGDNRVSLNELYYYAFNETLKQTETSAIGTQHPSFDITLVGSGDLVMTDISTAEAVLLLPSESQGRFLVRTLEGQLAAEINKNNNTSMSLALPAGFYSVTMIGDTSTTQAAVKLTKNTVYTLETASLKEIELSQGVARGSSINVENAGTSQEYLSDEEIEAIFASENTQPEENISLVKSQECNNWPSTFAISIFPGLGIPFDSKDARFVISPFMSMQHCISGSQINGFFGITTNKMQGIQVSGFGNVALKKVFGLQTAGFVNVSTNELTGVQSAGFVNVATGFVKGFQTAGFVNVSTGNFIGFQSAGFVNVAKNVKGVQLAGFVNVAKDVEGLQVGVINVAKSNTGVSFGLINIIKDGIFDPAVYWENGEIFIQYQGGTNGFYTTFLAGTPKDFSFDYGIIGAGAGVRIGKGFFGLDLEVLYKQFLSNNIGESLKEIEYLEDRDYGQYIKETKEIITGYCYPSVRAAMNFRFSKNFGLFVAVNGDFEVENWNEEAFGHRTDDKINSFSLGGTNVKNHIYWTFGLKF